MMRESIPLVLVAIVFLSLVSTAYENVDRLEIRGEVATGDFTWTPQNFAGFYYDLKKDLGTEQITTTLNGRKLSGDPPYGVFYKTTVQGKDYECRTWGTYKLIGFLGKKYFAGYIENTNDVEKNTLFRESTDENSLADEQLEEILIDNGTEQALFENVPLKLAQGYEIIMTSFDFDDGTVILNLKKDGSSIDTKQVSYYLPIYYFKKDIGLQRGLVIIAIHIKGINKIEGKPVAFIDGIWQISEIATAVEADTEFDKMTISTVDATNGVIEMNNKDNPIILSRNIDTLLMDNIHIKTAESDTLRYYIYKNETNPGTYEVQGAVANGDNVKSFTWTPQNFAGLYYDLDKDLGTEEISAMLFYGNKLSGDYPYGLTYMTTTQTKEFDFEEWGSYMAVAFLTEPYFAGYTDATSEEILESANNTNLLYFGHLTKVLIDDGEGKVIGLGEPIEMKEGYSIKPTVGTDNKGILVELLRNGKVIDREALILPGTYVYSSSVGNASGVPIIAAGFEEPIFLDGRSYCKVYGLWQISENPIYIAEGVAFGKMSVDSIDSISGSISMVNKDNQITLSKNVHHDLMDNISIRTADNDTLRYYLYKTVELLPAGGSR